MSLIFQAYGGAVIPMQLLMDGPYYATFSSIFRSLRTRFLDPSVEKALNSRQNDLREKMLRNRLRRDIIWKGFIQFESNGK